MNNIHEIIKTFAVTEQFDKLVMFNILASHFNTEQLSNIYAYATSTVKMPTVPSPAYAEGFEGEIEVIEIDYCQNNVEIKGKYKSERYFDDEENARLFTENNGEGKFDYKYWNDDTYKYVGYSTNVTTTTIPLSSISSTPISSSNN